MIRLLLAAVSCVAGFDEPVPPPAPDATYEQLRAVAGRDAEAQVKLALWCEAHGLEKERLRHLAVATLADPSNALARGLLGLVEFNGKWKQPDAVARDLKSDMAHADLLAEYNGRRAKAPVTVASQYKLALWCEEKGLKDESRAHLATVVRLDPNHADAWKRLGYKKVGNRWTTDAQANAEKAEHTAQQAADKHWKSRLEKLRDALAHKGTKRDEAERELATVTDPRSVPMVWKVFVQGHEKQHLVAVQLLGQIDAAAASRALATLTLTSKSDEVRRRATETLKRRDPREYAGMLVALLRDPIRYQVRPVGGPGSPGALFVEGKQVNVQRLYSPPSMPNLLPANGAYVLGYDNAGYLTAYQFGPGPTTTSKTTHIDQSFSYQQFANYHPTNPLAAKAVADFQSDAPAIMANFWKSHPITAGLARNSASGFNAVFSFELRDVITTTTPHEIDVQIPIGRVAAEYQTSAVVAQEQLASDIAVLDRANAEIKVSNGQLERLLRDISGKDLTDDREGWRKWFKNLQGYAYYTTSEDPKPTVFEDVPLGYQPLPSPTLAGTFVSGPVKTTFNSMDVIPSSKVSCFGAGMLVRTISGPRAIETLLIGDLVLSQNVRSGRLGYQPITVVHHNPPSPTYVITAGDDPIVSSHFHRFWVAGRGWVMARDLKVGDPIRTLGDVVKVTAIVPGKVQRVFNLDVADDADFFVGSVGALVHDNSLPDLRLAPFDAPSGTAVK